jgi:hypothetical protein
MARTVRTRLWIELGLAATGALCLLLTLLSKEWIELVFRIDPDHHSGSAEWTIVVLSGLAAVLFAALGRHEWRRAASTA